MISVSYTHLDVYKRQENIRVPNPDYVEPEDGESAAAIIGEGMVGDSVVASDDTVQPYTIYTATEYTAHVLPAFWRGLVLIEVQHIIN